MTLLGVVTGGVIASRSQRRQWARDKQIDACSALIQESTRMQLALRRQWRQQETPDWTPWNQALATIWLVGSPAVLAEARRMDRIFWLCGARIKNGLMTGEDTWALARDEMELSRRDFINAARREVVDTKIPVDDVPVARPPLSEIRELFGSTSPDTALSEDAHGEVWKSALLPR